MPDLGRDVLQYWLASLRLEEALSARPRARRPARGALDVGPPVPNSEAPTPGQDYFKLPLSAPPSQANDAGTGAPVSTADVICRGKVLMRPFDAELAGFFEDHLYRAMRTPGDEDDAGHLLCFPVVHLARGELAGLLRMRTTLTFHHQDGKPFRLPRRQRRRGGAASPPATPPVEARLVYSGGEPEDWPFFIDTRLLHRQLGFDGAAIDRLFEGLRACETMTESRMLTLVLQALEQQVALTDGPAGGPVGDRLGAAHSTPKEGGAGVTTSNKPDPARLIDRLTRAMKTLVERHGPRARVYPFGIVMGAAQTKTTWHLQREIQGLLRTGAKPPRGGDPLTSYLTGAPLPAGRDWQRSLCDGPDLTGSQRRAAEHVWGSALSAVQGPPGTGKTTLIQHLCAEFLMRKLEPLADGKDMRADIMLVTSSNNRAVDNALERFEGGSDALPLFLRAGSRRVCEGPLSSQLQATLGWLSQAGRRSNRDADLEAAQTHFGALRDRCSTCLADARQAFDRERRLAEVTRELRVLGPAPPAALSEGPTPQETVSAGLDERSLSAITVLEGRLSELSDLCDRPASLPALQTVARHFARTEKKHLADCTEVLQALGVALPLPPDLPASSDPETLIAAWQDATEDALSALGDAAQHAREQLDLHTEDNRRRQLEAELQRLTEAAQGTQPAAAALPEADARELFTAAVALREAWAAKHAAPLQAAVQTALHQCREARSLKPMARDDPDGYQLLQRLFGLWGCTLLSLGNCFPPNAGSVAQLVIDEAGQCHPAHAVSGLLRSRSALLIGDVHQLTPVVQLSRDDDARLMRQLKLRSPVDALGPYRIHAESHASVQSLADRAAQTALRLTDHFRCQPAIIDMSDKLCGYGLIVHTPQRSRVHECPQLCVPVGWLEVAGHQERLGGSWINAAELEAVFAFAQTLVSSGIPPDDIAVITPYRGQLERLRRGFARHGMAVETSPEMLELDVEGNAYTRTGIALGTVHRFQGGERSVVLFTSVVSDSRSLTFLNQRPNLINVAVSRARDHFVGIGQRQVLASGAVTGVLANAAQPLTGHPPHFPPT